MGKSNGRGQWKMKDDFYEHFPRNGYALQLSHISIAWLNGWVKIPKAMSVIASEKKCGVLVFSGIVLRW